MADDYIVKIKHPDINSGDYVRILCDKVTAAGSVNLDASPDLNSTTISDVQTQTFENVAYSIAGVRITAQADTLSYSDILTLYKSKYNSDTNVTHLVVNFGTTDTDGNFDPTVYQTLVGSALTAPTEIPVVLKSFSFPIDVTSSIRGHMPIGTLNFIETK